MLLAAVSHAQTPTKDYRSVCDSVRVLLKERTTVDTELSMKSVVKKGSSLDFHFSEELSDYHWTLKDIDWLRSELKRQAPEGYGGYSVGNIYAKNTPVGELITPTLGRSGAPSDYKWRYDDRRGKVKPLVSRVGGKYYKRGLSGRHIALWQSHGRYYDEASDRWIWQRAPLFTTVEDMYTQSYVLQFLIPMLENAGAYVMTPRERDIQREEVIIDNDPAFEGVRADLVRKVGVYSERGSWSDAGVGFADAKRVYCDNDNPFRMGSARKAQCATDESGRKAEARWEFTVPRSGEYAVYVSYKSVSGSTDAAHYTVSHLAGKTEFSVNQRMGGGTWIYLGTFEFAEDSPAEVLLDNITSDGKGVVTADAVKIGGGMGKIARGPADAPKDEWTTSGMPCFAEGSLYWEQFAGVDTTVTRNWEGDYTQDFASRGAWVTMMAGGSEVNPAYEGEGKKIPFDLSLAFHSDAGLTPNDSIIGTLSIYTLLADGKDKLPDGRSRQLCRHLAGIVQDQVCEDIRADFEPLWSKRMLWNKSYSESRTTSVPGMLLELLSHQNFADQRLGLDPTFRFEACRAVYKGMLKFLSDEHGIPYVVQPLSVNSFSARLTGDGEVTLSWRATADPKEPTADARDFILYTRVGDGVFDQGVDITDLQLKDGVYSTVVGIDADEIYSYRIVAQNEGGRSFPSQTLSVGQSGREKGKVLVVNNFDRVSTAAWFDSETYAGFDRNLDSGVGYGYEINYVGDTFDFRRDSEWTDDSDPGFGGSDVSHAGEIIPGNTFDFVRIHGRSILAAGYSFDSASREAFVRDGSNGEVLDLLCGKQVRVRVGSGAVPDRYAVFPEDLRRAIEAHTAAGGGVIVSGANIATDVWSEVFPVEVEENVREEEKKFVMETLGYSFQTDHGGFSGRISPTKGFKALGEPFEYRQKPDGVMYCVENPDGIKPASKGAAQVLRYTDSGVGAAVSYDAEGYRAVSFGFPLESVTDGAVLDALVGKTLEYINRQ